MPSKFNKNNNNNNGNSKKHKNKWKNDTCFSLCTRERMFVCTHRLHNITNAVLFLIKNPYTLQEYFRSLPPPLHPYLSLSLGEWVKYKILHTIHIIYSWRNPKKGFFSISFINTQTMYTPSLPLSLFHLVRYPRFALLLCMGVWVCICRQFHLVGTSGTLRTFFIAIHYTHQTNKAFFSEIAY